MDTLIKYVLNRVKKRLPQICQWNFELVRKIPLAADKFKQHGVSNRIKHLWNWEKNKFVNSLELNQLIFNGCNYVKQWFDQNTGKKKKKSKQIGT